MDSHCCIGQPGKVGQSCAGTFWSCARRRLRCRSQLLAVQSSARDASCGPMFLGISTRTRSLQHQTHWAKLHWIVPGRVDTARHCSCSLRPHSAAERSAPQCPQPPCRQGHCCRSRRRQRHHVSPSPGSPLHHSLRRSQSSRRPQRKLHRSEIAAQLCPLPTEVRASLASEVSSVAEPGLLLLLLLLSQQPLLVAALRCLLLGRRRCHTMAPGPELPR
mmetsp:Transcript_25898/g.86184  ORF Transcript_25898/g.86184 Transcript_25898/m.86184 type:complete len:218 (-) Transcript_25898:209-862(-)